MIVHLPERLPRRAAIATVVTVDHPTAPVSAPAVSRRSANRW
jgi:hypothetical protein